MNAAHIAVATAAALAMSASVAAAKSAVGLVGDNTLVMIDAKQPAAGKTVAVKGVERLLGIDVRPADKKLYGVSTDGTVVTIDPMTGETSKVSTLDKMIPSSVQAIVDFNPAADKLRFMGSDGTNLRADVTSGKVTTDGNLAFEQGDMHAGERIGLSVAPLQALQKRVAAGMGQAVVRLDSLAQGHRQPTKGVAEEESARERGGAEVLAVLEAAPAAEPKAAPK